MKFMQTLRTPRLRKAQTGIETWPVRGYQFGWVELVEVESDDLEHHRISKYLGQHCDQLPCIADLAVWRYVRPRNCRC